MTPQEQLCEKMRVEQSAYCLWLTAQPPEEILHHAYEYSVREDIILATEEMNLTPAQVRALLKSPAPLADVYKDFSKLETDYMSIVAQCVEDRADDLLKKEQQQNPPKVYRQSVTYAREHGELQQYHASCHLNERCRDEIDAALAQRFDGMRLGAGAVEQVVAEYGLERTKYVLAAASLVHCVLFQEEQAGYLAGYAAVTDGYTTLGFIGAREVPGIVRYCTGFLQGAEAAAELQGEYVTLQTWFTDTYENNDAITQRMIDWYNNGTSLIMVSGGNLYEGVSGAVNQTGGKAITTDYDNTELGDRVLGSAIKCYNAAVQRQLYTFFAAGTWNGQTGGQTEKAGFTNGEVALVAGAPWRFDSFTQDDYRTLYEDLRTSVLKMDAYSDLDTLPETPNVTVNRLP